MTNAEKLHALADWFDARHPGDPQPEVQRDLRNIAVRLQVLEAAAEFARQYRAVMQRGGDLRTPWEALGYALTHLAALHETSPPAPPPAGGLPGWAAGGDPTSEAGEALVVPPRPAATGTQPQAERPASDPTLPRGAYEAVPRRCTDPACPDRRNGTGEHMHLTVRYHPGAATTAELFTVGPAPHVEGEP